MATKVIGPIVQSGSGPDKDNTKDCPTGWCDNMGAPGKDIPVQINKSGKPK